jgi:hypothetical protein
MAADHGVQLQFCQIITKNNQEKNKNKNRETKYGIQRHLRMTMPSGTLNGIFFFLGNF